MRKIFLIYFFLFAFGAAGAQTLSKPIAASIISPGAYSIDHVDVFSVWQNVASLAQLREAGFGVYGERRFLLAQTSFYSSVIALPTEDGNFAFQADYFGFKNFNKSQIGFAYARKMGDRFNLGMKVNYYSFRIPGYQNPSTVDFEIGGIVHITEKLNAGINLYNPVGGKLSKTENEKLGSVYTLGIGYEASPDFLIAVEVQKQEELPVNVNAAVEYDFAKKFFAQFGVATENESPFGAAGISWDQFRLNVSASFHPQLGLTPGLQLIMNLKSKEVESN